MTEQSLASSGVQTSNLASATGFQSCKRFYDDANFPKGFRRSGDFTHKEAELLELYGEGMRALAEGTREPITPEETQFVDAVRNNHSQSGLLVQIWLKYCRLAKGKPFYAVVGTLHAAASASETDSELTDLSDDDELSNDEEAKEPE